MRGVALLVLAVALDGAAAPTPAAKAEGRCRFRECVRTRGANGGPSYATFEFAPLDGAGMGAPCACAAVTGAKGEAMTFARGSSGTCLKGGTTSGIANGDLVTCASNQPRVMPGSDGSGGLGLVTEGSHTNQLPRSEEFENAAWLLGNTGTSNPTVTANQAVAPDGTTTADRVQFPATTAVQASWIGQAFAFNSITAGSVFVKGNGSSGTIDVCVCNTTAGSTHDCAPCAFNATTWSRCAVRNVANANANADIIIGNGSSYNGGTARGAADVFLWGAQWEQFFETTYIKTTSAAVVRSEDFGYFTVSIPLGTTWSQAVTWVSPPLFVASTAGFLLEPSAATPAGNRFSVYNETDVILSQYSVVNSALYKTQRSGLVLGTSQRFAGYYDGTNQSACLDGACSTSVPGYNLSTMTPIIRIAIGNFATGGSPGWGVVKRVCFDPSLARCR